MTTLDRVRKIVADTLLCDTRSVGAHDDLFDRLGCDMLGFANIVSTLERDFSVALSAAEVERCRTPAAFAAVIERKWEAQA